MNTNVRPSYFALGSEIQDTQRLCDCMAKQCFPYKAEGQRFAGFLCVTLYFLTPFLLQMCVVHDPQVHLTTLLKTILCSGPRSCGHVPPPLPLADVDMENEPLCSLCRCVMHLPTLFLIRRYLLFTQFPGQSCTWCFSSASLSLSVFMAAASGFRPR